MSKNKKDLTECEIKVLDLLKHSMTNVEIGKKLFISHHTVHAHKELLSLKNLMPMIAWKLL